jgi:sugar phosphate isomerase/epimerase
MEVAEVSGWGRQVEKDGPIIHGVIGRREFLRRTGGVAAVMLAYGAGLHAENKDSGDVKNPIGLQLSTLIKSRAEAGALESYLKQIARIGFNEVEPWRAVYTVPAVQLRTMIFNAGLKVASGHFEYTDLAADLPGQIRYAQTLGLKWMVCPMLPHVQWGAADGFHEAARTFNSWAKQVQDGGMRFAFHNHDYEFRPFDGRTGFDILVEETERELVSFELDCYWVTQAGQDPAKLIDRLGSRVRMLHVKDRRRGSFPFSYDMSASSSHFTEVGSGSIDWREVIGRARAAGVEHYFIEQDQIAGPPLGSLLKSYTSLRSLLG